MKGAWLQAPHQREMRRYHRDPAISWCLQWVLIDHGLPISGEQAMLKRRRRVTRNAALLDCEGVQKTGWRRVSPQWSELLPGMFN